MNTKTGTIKTIEEFEAEEGAVTIKRKITEGEIVPIPEDQVALVKGMTWLEKQNWLNAQAKLKKA